MENEWYKIDEEGKVDSPALLVYRERVVENIATAISMVGEASRLRPHVKTHKTIEGVKLMLDSDITKFKCATISEGEMLAMAGAPDVLLAYQPAGPKLKRFIKLIKKYDHTYFSCLVDNEQSLKEIAEEARKNEIEIPVYIDLNVGMNRTGIEPGTAASNLFRKCADTRGVKPKGLHVYDGHIRTTNIEQRTIECDRAFGPVLEMQKSLLQDRHREVVIIAGGSPTFSIHAKRKEMECSPGTFIFWDRGYELAFPEQKFLPAALVISRIISKPGEGKLCLDLGHKSVAAENVLEKRVYFLNAPELKFVSQSEEHLVVETPKHLSYKVGDVLYGVPYHVCPTVALYERALVIENGEVTAEWKIIARDRKITV